MGAPMQRIDRMSEPPEVGRFYLVPTVRYPYFGRIRDWPVMGVLHHDQEHFNFPWPHYHVDPRFINATDFAFIERQRHLGYTVDVLLAGNPLCHFSGGYRPWRRDVSLEEARAETDEHPSPVLRRRRMHRPWTYPRSQIDGHSTGKIRSLWEAYAGQRAKRGRHGFICPHRNYPLGTARADENGILVCPLHGLRICGRTGLVEKALREGMN